MNTEQLIALVGSKKEEFPVDDWDDGCNGCIDDLITIIKEALADSCIVPNDIYKAEQAIVDTVYQNIDCLLDPVSEEGFNEDCTNFIIKLEKVVLSHLDIKNGVN